MVSMKSSNSESIGLAISTQTPVICTTFHNYTEFESLVEDEVALTLYKKGKFEIFNTFASQGLIYEEKMNHFSLKMHQI